MVASTDAPTVVHTERDGEPSSLIRLPPELRLEIYRHYFSDLISLKVSTRTVWSNTAESLSLLQTGSRVRREAAPVLYEECIGNQNRAKPHSWVLETRNPQQWLLRLKAMSKSLAQQTPKVEVTTRLVHNISIPESSTFAALTTRLGFRRHALLESLRLADILDYLQHRLTEHPFGELGGLQSQHRGFVETIDDFVVAYSYNSVQQEERLSLRGSLATFD